MRFYTHRHKYYCGIDLVGAFLRSVPRSCGTDLISQRRMSLRYAPDSHKHDVRLYHR